jgi:hypothetical protein
MLRRNKSRLLLIAASFFLIVTVSYAVTVFTFTFNLNIADAGGTPTADVSASATHQFASDVSAYTYSYSTSVFHDGSFVDDDWQEGGGSSPAAFQRSSYASGSDNAVHSQHDTTASHGSYIEDSTDYTYSHSAKGSNTSRATDGP